MRALNSDLIVPFLILLSKWNTKWEGFNNIKIFSFYFGDRVHDYGNDFWCKCGGLHTADRRKTSMRKTGAVGGCGWTRSGSAVQCGSCQSSRFVPPSLEAADALITVYLHAAGHREEKLKYVEHERPLCASKAFLSVEPDLNYRVTPEPPGPCIPIILTIRY